jgi:hypothetical protein
MTDVAYKMAMKEAGSDKMLYAFARYLTHCVQVHHVALCHAQSGRLNYTDADPVMSSTCRCCSPRCMPKSAACSCWDTMCRVCDRCAACACFAGCH